LDYTRFDLLLSHLRFQRPEFVINAAGVTGKPNVDACEDAKAETLLGNTLFPVTLAQACLTAGVPFGHVSSGCIYAGGKVAGPDGDVIQKDLMRPDLRSRILEDRAVLKGFKEDDEPNFSFRSPPCSFYSGTKALAEEGMRPLGGGYLWRLRIPFDEYDSPKNYLSKLLAYPKVYDNVNSISHRGDFVRACLDLWAKRAPFGVYNIVNPGYVTTRDVVRKIQAILKPARRFEFWENDEEFYRVAARTPRSNCVLDTAKLLGAGVDIRPVDEALDASLRAWVPR
jgi:dTDP-4-dehydrorhamnose reductase